VAQVYTFIGKLSELKINNSILGLGEKTSLVFTFTFT
jgi:hypothetical protein